jgi:hypothetical protein
MHNVHLLLNSNTTTHLYRIYCSVYLRSLHIRPIKSFFILLQACCSGSTGSWGVKNTIEMHNFVTPCHVQHFSQYTIIFTVQQHAKQMKVQCSKCKEKWRLNQAESVISQSSLTITLCSWIVNSMLWWCSINIKIPGVDSGWCVSHILNFLCW